MTFHKVLPEQYQTLKLSTPMGVDKKCYIKVFGALSLQNIFMDAVVLMLDTGPKL